MEITVSRKADLRKQRDGTIINTTSKKQESQLIESLRRVISRLTEEFSVEFRHESKMFLADVVSDLENAFPEIPFEFHFQTSYMQPDGGILSIIDDFGVGYPVLITEVKNQGTNDLRVQEGKKPQSKGNAIERLGKNVIGFRTAMLTEQIMPFLCFGYGCDFEETSSILDRVSTIAMFGPLNTVSVVNEGEGGIFNRGSFYFREEAWTVDEMTEVMTEVARRSIHYYFAKYGESTFKVVE